MQRLTLNIRADSVYDQIIAADEAIAPRATVVRKVRTAQGTMLDNVKAEQSDGKCNRKKPRGVPGTGEQENSRAVERKGI